VRRVGYRELAARHLDAGSCLYTRGVIRNVRGGETTRHPLSPDGSAAVRLGRLQNATSVSGASVAPQPPSFDMP
jgi:hypothetical protein